MDNKKDQAGQKTKPEQLPPPENKDRKDRLTNALRQNLQRRKGAGKKKEAAE